MCERRGAVNVLGLTGCPVLTATVPAVSAPTMLGLFAVGLAGRAPVLARRRR